MKQKKPKISYSFGFCFEGCKAEDQMERQKYYYTCSPTLVTLSFANSQWVYLDASKHGRGGIKEKISVLPENGLVITGQQVLNPLWGHSSSLQRRTGRVEAEPPVIVILICFGFLRACWT